MSDKMECPGCNSYTSSVLFNVSRGEPCPYCGLSADSLVEILSVREMRANSSLKGRVEELLKERDGLKREVTALKQFKYSIEASVEELRTREGAL